MTAPTLAEPACPGPAEASTPDSLPDAPGDEPVRASATPLRRHPARDLGRPRGRQPVGHAVLVVGVPAGVVGCLRRQRPRGDARRRRSAAPSGSVGDRAAHAPSRGRAERRRDRTRMRGDSDAELTPVATDGHGRLLRRLVPRRLRDDPHAPRPTWPPSPTRSPRTTRRARTPATWDAIDLRRLRCGDPAGRGAGRGLRGARDGRTAGR